MEPPLSLQPRLPHGLPCVISSQVWACGQWPACVVPVFQSLPPWLGSGLWDQGFGAGGGGAKFDLQFSILRKTYVVGWGLGRCGLGVGLGGVGSRPPPKAVPQGLCDPPSPARPGPYLQSSDLTAPPDRCRSPNPTAGVDWAPLTRKRHIPPHSAQPQHANHWAPRTRKRHQQEHRPQRPTERSDPTQHAKGRTGDRPGPRKGATTRRNVAQGVQAPCLCVCRSRAPWVWGGGPGHRVRAQRHTSPAGLWSSRGRLCGGCVCPGPRAPVAGAWVGHGGRGGLGVGVLVQTQTTVTYKCLSLALPLHIGRWPGNDANTTVERNGRTVMVCPMRPATPTNTEVAEIAPTTRPLGGRALLEGVGGHRGSPRAVVERSRGM